MCLGHAEQCGGRADAAALLLPLAPQVMQGLLGALLAPSPLARVSKVTIVLAGLASLTLQGSEPQLATGVGSMGAAMLQWLSSALDGIPRGSGNRPLKSAYHKNLILSLALHVDGLKARHVQGPVWMGRDLSLWTCSHGRLPNCMPHRHVIAVQSSTCETWKQT